LSHHEQFAWMQNRPSMTLKQDLPVWPLFVEEQIVVGEPLPDRVRVRPIPRSEYRYALVNGRRVIVDPRTRRILRILS
jgi:hypothetical protein